MSVHLHARLANGKTGTFAVARERDMRHASTLVSRAGGRAALQTVHLPSHRRVVAAGSNCSTWTHDSIFEDALTMAARAGGPAAAWRPR